MGQSGVRSDHSDSLSLDELVGEFEALGFTVVNQVLRPVTCARFARHIESEIRRPAGQRSFGSIREPENRYDVPFEVSGLARDLLQEACRHPVLKGLLCRLVTAEASLEELAGLTSYPGAAAQDFHPDTLYKEGDGLLATAFIALDDLDETMGPLEVIWGSSRARDVGSAPRASRMTLGCGDAVIIDSTTIHRGGANVSAARPRPVFYFSFLSPWGTRPVGATYSILMGEQEKLTLARFL
jgi:hypothetical protein